MADRTTRKRSSFKQNVPRKKKERKGGREGVTHKEPACGSALQKQKRHKKPEPGIAPRKPPKGVLKKPQALGRIPEKDKARRERERTDGSPYKGKGD